MKGFGEHTIYERNWMFLGVEIYFRIRRMSHWLARGIIVFPFVFSIGNYGIGSNCFWRLQKEREGL